MPNRVVSLFKSKSFKLALAIVLFVAAVLIILAMTLGNQAGQFVIRVQSGAADKSIAITDSKDVTDDKQYAKTKTVPGIENMLDYSPGYFLTSGYKKLNEYPTIIMYTE